MTRPTITFDADDGRQWVWKAESDGWRIYRGHGDGGLYTDAVFTTRQMLEWFGEAAGETCNRLEVVESALRDIRAEVSHGPTANWEYIEKRFAEALDG